MQYTDQTKVALLDVEHDCNPFTLDSYIPSTYVGRGPFRVATDHSFCHALPCVLRGGPKHFLCGYK